MLVNGNGVALIDVRETHEFEAGHLPGARHVPRGHLESRIEGAAPDRDQRVILYCATGHAPPWPPTRCASSSATRTSSP